MDTAQLHEVRYSFARPQSWPNGLWKLLPGVCRDLVAATQIEILRKQKKRNSQKQPHE